MAGEEAEAERTVCVRLWQKVQEVLPQRRALLSLSARR
jgi:hypothetical protein